MNLVPVRNSHLGYIPVSQIVDETPLRFRRPDPHAVDAVGASFLRGGQTHPVLLEALSDGNFRVIDGYRRLEAAREISRRGGAWPKLLAHVVLPPKPVLLLRWLWARNGGSGGYGPTETGRLASWALASGVDERVIARETGFSAADLEDLLELAETPEELASLMDRARLETRYAAMLLRSYMAWKATRNGPLAIETASRLIEHGRRSPLTIKGWRFLLDFYWSDDRPFMIETYRKTPC
jgi:ParB-like chromosome segregation protein Spo0J